MVPAPPHESRLLVERFRQAVARLENGLSTVYACEKLTEDQCRQLALTGNVRVAWKVTGAALGSVTELFLSVDAAFPASVPTLWLRPAADWFLKIPHVNRNGSICLLAEHSTVDQYQCGKVAIELVSMALGVISDGLAGKNRDDFILEAEGYWAQTAAGTRLTTFTQLAPPTRILSAILCPTRNRILLGDDRSLLQTRLAALGDDWMKNSRRAEAIFLWSEEPLFPHDYPKTNTDLAALATRLGISALPKLIAEAHAKRHLLPVIIAFPSGNGTAAFGASFSHLDSPIKGYRTTSITPQLLLARFGKSACGHHVVERANPEYLRWRTGDDHIDFKVLAPMRVLIVGCGSLGADVAMLLAKAGVNRLTLVDNEALSWDNIGRHLLGASSVGSNKAVATAKALRAHLPHLEVQTEENRIEDLLLKRSDFVEEHDVIVCLTGDWKTESLLNLWQRRRRSKQVVFGWVEPHGFAGHALLVTRYGGCLACGRDEVGEVRDQVTEWQGETLRRVPACGGAFTPHAALETTATKSMIADLVLNALLKQMEESRSQVYVGSAADITNAGGTISDQWKSRIDPDHKSVVGRTISTGWPVNPVCPLCRAD